MPANVPGPILFFVFLTIFSLVNALYLPYSMEPVLSATMLVWGGFIAWFGLSFLKSFIRRPFVLYLFILPLSVILSVPGAISFHLALLNFFRLIALIGILVGAYTAGTHIIGRRYLQLFLYAFLLLCCLTGIYEMLFPVEMPLHWTGVDQAKALPFRVSSFFVNPNLWGAFSAIMVSTLTALLLVEETSESQNKIGLLLFFFAVNLGGTFSRGAWLSTIAGLMITFILIMLKKVNCPGKKSMIKFLLAGMIPLFLLLYPSLSSRLSTLVKPGEFGMKQRILLYKGVVSHVIDNLPFGSGAGSFQTLFPKYRIVGGQYVYEAHSDFLQYFAESGLAGFVGLVIFIGGILLFSIKGVRQKKECLPLFAFFITFAVAGNTVSFFHYSFLIVPVFVTGGLLLSAAGFNGKIIYCEPTEYEPHEVKILKPVIVVLCIGGSLYWGGMLASEYVAAQAQAIGRQGGRRWSLAIEGLSTASELCPLRSDLYYRKGLYKMKQAKEFDVQGAVTIKAGEIQKKKLIEDGQILFNKAVSLNTGESLYRQAKAQLYVVDNDFEQALTSIDGALEFDPCSVHMALEKSAILQHFGRSNEAIEILKSALESNRSFISINQRAYAPVISKLVELLQRAGRKTEVSEMQNYGKLLRLRSLTPRERKVVSDR